MKTTTSLLLIVALFASPASKAQQTPSTQPQPQPQQSPQSPQPVPAAPAQVKPAPCVPHAADPSKQVRIKPNSKLQQIFEKQRAKIEQATGLTLPDKSLDELVRQAQTPAPCPLPPTTSPAPATPKQ